MERLADRLRAFEDEVRTLFRAERLRYLRPVQTEQGSAHDHPFPR